MSRLLILCLLAGCTVPPSAAPSPRNETVAAASSDKVWTAVLDEMAAQSIPTRVIDRAAGVVASGEVALPVDGSRLKAADCGSTLGESIRPVTAEYRVVVRDSAVRATSRWTSRDAVGTTACVSRGVWEAAFESAVKARAER